MPSVQNTGFRSASRAAASMAARGAVSPVQISNWRTACSINIFKPGMTCLPWSRARRIRVGFERIVDHVEDDIAGDLVLETGTR